MSEAMQVAMVGAIGTTATTLAALWVRRHFHVADRRRTIEQEYDEIRDAYARLRDWACRVHQCLAEAARCLNSDDAEDRTMGHAMVQMLAVELLPEPPAPVEKSDHREKEREP